MHPRALVVGVIDHFGLELSLVLGVGDQGGLPLSVVLIVPVLRLARLGIGDLLGNVIPSFGLDILGVRDLLKVDPVLRLGLLRVLDLLGQEKVKVIGQVALNLGEGDWNGTLCEKDGLAEREGRDRNALLVVPRQSKEHGLLQATKTDRLLLLVINADLVRVVGLDNQGVQVRQLVGLAGDRLSRIANTDDREL